MKNADLLPNEQEPIIDIQNRQIALRNRAISVQESRIDISDENYNADKEPLII